MDFNVVMTEDGNFVELQGSGEESVFTSSEMQEMLKLSQKGIEDLVGLQREAILAAGQTHGDSLPDLGSA